MLSRFAIYLRPLIIVERLQYSAGGEEMFARRHWTLQTGACMALILICVVFGVEDNAAFIYFQF